VVKQYGFYFDSERCIQCRTCEVACSSIHNTEPGIKWRRVIEIWSGEFPDVTRTFFSYACMHCGKPACEVVCPTGAISKRAEDGIVVVDRDKCNGCQECFLVCPYDVPQFGADGTMQMCDFCVELGNEPACVAHCPTEALHYGTIDKQPELPAGKVAEKIYGTTEPSVIIIHKRGVNMIQNMLAGL
jgi:anaerobic dimethyl sulfoxide reductase subunit B (iron-sulfur subunit)